MAFEKLILGERLFQGATASDVLAQVLTKEPDWERVPAKVRRLSQRCLEKDAAKRLRDISGVGLLLEEQPPVSAPSRVQRAHGLGWIVVGMAVLIAVALGFGWWRAKGPVERPLMRFSADLGPEAVENPGITAVISPDGARLAFAVRGSGGKTQLAMRLLDQAQATLLAGTENAVHPFFSPDGQWIGFFADGKMKKISVQGGAAVTLCEAPSDRSEERRVGKECRSRWSPYH